MKDRWAPIKEKEHLIPKDIRRVDQECRLKTSLLLKLQAENNIKLLVQLKTTLVQNNQEEFLKTL